jgi:hypothetical protein
VRTRGFQQSFLAVVTRPGWLVGQPGTPRKDQWLVTAVERVDAGVSITVEHGKTVRTNVVPLDEVMFRYVDEEDLATDSAE